MPKKSTEKFIKEYLCECNPIGYTTRKFQVMVNKKVECDYIKEYIRNMNYQDFLYSVYWVIVRNEVKKRDKQCMICGNKHSLIAHHTTYSIRGEEHNNLDKIITMCSKCHKKHHKAKNN